MSRFMSEESRPAPAPTPDLAPEPAPVGDDGALSRLIRGLFGPPWQALKRSAERAASWLGLVLGRFLEFWNYLFLGQPGDEGGTTTPPAKTSLLLAAVTLALTLYSWPARDIFPWWVFVPVCLLVLWLAFRAIQFASLRGSGSRWEAWLRQSERRVGLVWWERAGLALSLVATVAAVLVQPTVIPLTGGMAAGFLVLLGQPPERRELRTIRVVPPLPPVVDPDVPPSPETPSEFVTRNFAWTVRHEMGVDSHELELSLHEPTYRSVKANNPGYLFDGEIPRYADYIVDGTTPDIERAAAALFAQAQDHRYSTYEEISLALAFVQSITYSFDEDSVGKTEYWRFPIETLYDETGDCEDTTILAGALLRRLGHAVVALDLPGHAALGVEAPPGVPGQFVEHEGRRMYFCETTGTGWRVGEVPSSMAEQEMTVIPVPSFPLPTSNR